MRTFVISDIHGLGSIYYPVMGYLENLSKYDNITLYINGDLIDRGEDSAKILIDVINRCKSNNKIKIEYIGGNHELLMYQEYKYNTTHGHFRPINPWYENAGWVTDDGLVSIYFDDLDKILDIVDFIGELPVYKKLDNKILDKNVVIAHAACPAKVLDNSKTKIKTDDEFVRYVTWARGNKLSSNLSAGIGNPDYFSILGHTYNNSYKGYYYNALDNSINIDGGCYKYACGLTYADHSPLVEVCDGYLRILTFNNSNEIIYGNYFDEIKSIPFTEEELINENKLLNKDIKVRKLTMDDSIKIYERTKKNSR